MRLALVPLDQMASRAATVIPTSKVLMRASHATNHKVNRFFCACIGDKRHATPQAGLQFGLNNSRRQTRKRRMTGG
jgi:hypothetical protein